MPPAAMPVRGGGGGGGGGQRMDASSGWGSGVKVDQMTPWDTAPSAAAQPVIAHNMGHEAKSNEWGGGGGGGASSRDGTARWSQPQQQPAAGRQPNYDNDMNWHGGAGGTAHWGAGAHGGPPPAGNTGNWGGNGGGAGGHHHDQQQQQQHPVRLFLSLKGRCGWIF